MKFLKISDNTTLSDLNDRIGSKNISNLLNINSISRTYNIGKSYSDMCTNVAKNTSSVDWQRKSSILNTLASNDDVFEHACLMGEDSWKVFSSVGSFPGMLRLPDTVNIPDSTDILGNAHNVSKLIYQSVMNQLRNEPHQIDPASFNEISSIKHSSILSRDTGSTANTSIFDTFRIPWGKVSLYSSFSNYAIDFPVYPEQVDDGVTANYTQMPDLLYQYEPWQVYQSSGPRTCTYDFHMHRDMWTGDHRDGKCNELIRFCEAQCYAKYRGASVDTPTVTLYVSGKPLISGIMNNAKESWGGPIGLDGWYLECTLSISITEVAQSALNYDKVRQKSIIG